MQTKSSKPSNLTLDIKSKYSYETRKKISDALKGRTRSAEHRANLSRANTGKVTVLVELRDNIVELMKQGYRNCEIMKKLELEAKHVHNLDTIRKSHGLPRSRPYAKYRDAVCKYCGKNFVISSHDTRWKFPPDEPRFCCVAHSNSYHRGPQHPRYIDGLALVRAGTRQQIMRKYWYIKWRKDMCRRDGNKCTECSSTEKLELHHIKGWDEYPELRFEGSNVITLCRKCHAKTDNYGWSVMHGKSKTSPK